MGSIYGTYSSDTLYGTGYADSIYSYEGYDTVYAGYGDDYVDGWTGDDALYGEAGHDTLLGYDGNDYLYGGSGDDTLYGEAGNDYLSGGGYSYNSYEYDELSGGYGADKFVLGESYYGAYYNGAGYATITDFNWAEGDKFQVYGYESNYSLEYANWEGGTALDTLIKYNGDVIGVVQDYTDVSLSYDFNYVV